MKRWRWWAVLIWVSSGACGGSGGGGGDDDDDDDVDAGADAGGAMGDDDDDLVGGGPEIPWLAAGEPEVDPPEIDWLEDESPAISAPDIGWWDAPGHPVTRACPASWRSVAVAGEAPVCAPFPEDGVASCPLGQAHFPGEAGCTDLGRACPTGEWPSVADLPGGTRILYVRQGDPGGTGTLGDPFGTLDGALAAAGDGTVVVMAAGFYGISAALPGGVSLRGKCVSQTLVQNTTGLQRAVLDVTSGRATIRDLRVAPLFTIGVLVDSGGVVTLDGVAVLEASIFGITAQGTGRLTARGVQVSDTGGLRFVDGAVGAGVAVVQSAEVELDRAVLLRNEGFGAAVNGGAASLILRRTHVADTATLAFTADGQGVVADAGGTATLDRVVLDRSHFAGVWAQGLGTSVTADDVVVRGTLGGAEVAFGAGTYVTRGASLTGAGLRIDDSLTHGIRAFDDALVDLTDVAVRGTGVPNPSATDFGVGVAAAVGAEVTLRRAAVVRSRLGGLLVSDDTSVEDGDPRPADALLVAEDVLVRGLPAESSSVQGNGAFATGGGALVLRRAVVDGVRRYGVLAAGEGSSVLLEDAVVRETTPVLGGLPGGGDLAGVGLRINVGASGTIRRVIVEDNHEAGVCVSDERLDATDLVVRRTRHGPSGGCLGTPEDTAANAAGIVLARGAEAVIAGAVVDGNDYRGIYLQGEATRLTLSDAVLRSHRFVSPGTLLSAGIVAGEGTALEVDRVVIEDTSGTGLDLFGGLTPRDAVPALAADLEDLVVRRTTADPGFAMATGIGVRTTGPTDVDGARWWIEDSVLAGIEIDGPDADALLTDVRVDGTDGLGDGNGGFGLGHQGSGQIVLRDAVLSRSTRFGVLSLLAGDDAPAVLTLEDVLIADVRPVAADATTIATRQTRGWGINVVDSAEVVLRRTVVEGTHEVGIGSYLLEGGGVGVVSGEDVVVRDVAAPACTGCEDRPSGVGVAIYDRGRGSFAGFAFETSAFCAVQVDEEASLDLTDGRVENHQVAFCLASADYDVGRLTDRVQLIDNERRVETQEFVVPAPEVALPSTPPEPSREVTGDEGVDAER